MSIERSRRRANNQMRDGKNRFPNRQGLYDKYFPPKGTPQDLANLVGRQDTIAEPIIFIPGSYLDVIEGVRDDREPREEPDYHDVIHKFKNQNGFFDEEPCSQGPEPHAPKPCVPHYLHERGDKSMRPAERWTWNVIHLAIYHVSPRIKDGREVTKKDSNEVITDLKECRTFKRLFQLRGEGCKFCDANQPIQFGAHRHMGLGFGNQQKVGDWHAEAKQFCNGCGTRTMEVGFDCASCNAPLMDLVDCTWTQEEIGKYEETKVSCEGCGVVDFPAYSYDCGYNENGEKTDQGCPQEIRPAPRSLFDYIYWVHREGEDTNTRIAVKKRVLRQDYRMKILVGSDSEQEVIISDDFVNAICPSVYDFAEMFKPGSTEDQSKRFKVTDPYRVQSAGVGAPSTVAGGGHRVVSPPKLNIPGKTPAAAPKAVGKPVLPRRTY